jgi:probable phosphoglycerate mutase
MLAAHLCIARHGETDWNKRGVLQGWLDVPINARGRTQAQQMAADLAAADFQAIWSSPLARARETAEIIATALRLPAPTCHEGLREKHFGAIQGIPKNELAEQDPGLLEQILRRNPATHFVGGETMDETAERVLEAVQTIGLHHGGARVLVVTHGWVMDVVSRHVNGLPRHAVLAHKPQNGDRLWITVGRHIEPAQPFHTNGNLN